LVNVYITMEKHNSSWLNPLMSCYHWLIDTLALYKFTIPKNGECIHVAVGI
jgi:cytochrome b